MPEMCSWLKRSDTETNTALVRLKTTRERERTTRESDERDRGQSRYERLTEEGSDRKRGEPYSLCQRVIVSRAVKSYKWENEKQLQERISLNQRISSRSHSYWSSRDHYNWIFVFLDQTVFACILYTLFRYCGLMFQLTLYISWII